MHLYYYSVLNSSTSLKSENQDRSNRKADHFIIRQVNFIKVDENFKKKKKTNKINIFLFNRHKNQFYICVYILCAYETN